MATNGKNAAERFMKMNADGSQIMGDASTAANEFNAALQNLHTSWNKFALTNLGGPVKQLADGLNSLEDSTVQKWLNIGKYMGMVRAGLIAINKVAKLGGWMARLFGKGRRRPGLARGNGGAAGAGGQLAWRRRRHGASGHGRPGSPPGVPCRVR